MDKNTAKDMSTLAAQHDRMDLLSVIAALYGAVNVAQDQCPRCQSFEVSPMGGEDLDDVTIDFFWCENCNREYQTERPRKS